MPPTGNIFLTFPHDQLSLVSEAPAACFHTQALSGTYQQPKDGEVLPGITNGETEVREELSAFLAFTGLKSQKSLHWKP